MQIILIKQKNYVMSLLIKIIQEISLQTKIVWKFTIPYFKKLTTHLENENIPSTNNKIENIFQKVFSKHIKRIMKIEQGLSSRFMLKLNHWNINNEKEKNHTSFCKSQFSLYVKIYIVFIININNKL